jgi:RNA polymerase sigma factor (sigma-70 family)
VDVEHLGDEQLLRGSVTRPQLFVAFYRRHAVRLLSFFGRRTLDAHVAAELTAETMAEAFGSRMRYEDRGPGSAAAWLTRIAQHKLAHYIRHLQVEDRARRCLGVDTPELATSDIERIEELIDFERVGRTVAAAFGRLRAEQRRALELRILEGRSYADMACLLGCSEQVVRARVSRGLRSLAALLEAAEAAQEAG